VQRLASRRPPSNENCVRRFYKVRFSEGEIARSVTREYIFVFRRSRSFPRRRSADWCERLVGCYTRLAIYLYLYLYFISIPGEEGLSSRFFLFSSATSLFSTHSFCARACDSRIHAHVTHSTQRLTARRTHFSTVRCISRSHRVRLNVTANGRRIRLPLLLEAPRRNFGVSWFTYFVTCKSPDSPGSLKLETP